MPACSRVYLKTGQGCGFKMDNSTCTPLVVPTDAYIDYSGNDLAV